MVRKVTQTILVVPLVFGLLVGGCRGKLTGPSAPSGTNLAGLWVSDPIKFDVPGGPAQFVIEFTVDASSRTASNVVWRNSGGGVGNGWSGSATIENSRFKFEQQYEGSCNDNRKRLTLEVLFRSESEADGKWDSAAIAPPGYNYCGTAFGDFKPRRRP